MRLGVAAFLVLGTCSLTAWCVPLKSVYVSFPGDVIKNMTDIQMADVSISTYSFMVSKSTFSPLLFEIVQMQVYYSI